MIERVVAPRDVLAREFRRRLESLARDAIAARGAFSMAIPGGSVAQSFLPALVDGVSWTQVDLFWCDERVVPSDDPDSNWALAWHVWLRHLPAHACPRVHRMPVDTQPMERAAECYERELDAAIRLLGGVLDLALLGIGPDGHIASLFSRHPALTADEGRSVAAVRGAPKPPPDRLTLTLPFLARSRSVMLAAFGVEKAAIVRDILDDEASTAPAASLVRHRGSPSVIMLDAEAASLLRSRR